MTRTLRNQTKKNKPVNPSEASLPSTPHPVLFSVCLLLSPARYPFPLHPTLFYSLSACYYPQRGIPSLYTPPCFILCLPVIIPSEASLPSIPHAVLFSVYLLLSPARHPFPLYPTLVYSLSACYYPQRGIPSLYTPPWFILCLPVIIPSEASLPSTPHPVLFFVYLLLSPARHPFPLHPTLFYSLSTCYYPQRGIPSLYTPPCFILCLPVIIPSEAPLPSTPHPVLFSVCLLLSPARHPFPLHPTLFYSLSTCYYPQRGIPSLYTPPCFILCLPVIIPSEASLPSTPHPVLFSVYLLLSPARHPFPLHPTLFYSLSTCYYPQRGIPSLYTPPCFILCLPVIIPSEASLPSTPHPVLFSVYLLLSPARHPFLLHPTLFYSLSACYYPQRGIPSLYTPPCFILCLPVIIPSEASFSMSSGTLSGSGMSNPGRTEMIT